VSGTAQHGPMRQQQLRLESDMRELIGNDGSAENLQAFAVRNRFERAVIYVSNQFSADEHA
jgi:hypothetical protein